MQTRNKRKNSTSDPEAAKMSKKSVQNGRHQNGEVNQWIMVAPKTLLTKSNVDNKEQSPYIYKIPHPKSGVPALYAFKEKNVYEILKFSDKYRSWLYNDSVQEDGSIYILAPVDPMFLAIPFLDKVAKKGKYMTLEQTLIDKTYQGGISHLEQCLSISQLEAVCDCKGSYDLAAYKLDSEKLLNWLKLKVEKLAEHLKKSKMHVGAGSHAANFVKSSHENLCSDSEYLLYAFELISDYVTDDLAQELRGTLQIVSTPPMDIPKEDEPPAKRQKLNNDRKNTEAVEDYRDKQAKTDKKPVKLTAGQKQLAKIDKTGMKSLNSFFSAKPKKV